MGSQVKVMAGKEQAKAKKLFLNITSDSAKLVTHAVSFTVIRFYCPNQGRDTERFSWGLNPIYSQLYFVREIA